MKKATRLLSFLGITAAVSFTACTQDPLSVEQYSNNYPVSQPLIKRSEYKTGEHDLVSYKTGYMNGNLRTDRIILNWNQVSDGNFLCYKVYRSNGINGNPTTLVETLNNSSQTQYIDSNLAQNASYKYKVVVINGSGISKQDTIALKTPKKGSPSDQYVFVNFGENNIDLFWHNNAEYASSYDVFRKKSTDLHDSNYKKINTVAITDTTFSDKGENGNEIVSGLSYNYRVYVNSVYENKIDSLTFSVNANNSISAPTNLTVAQPQGTQTALLNWTTPNSVGDRIEISRKSDNQSNFKIIKTINDKRTALFYDTTAPLDTNLIYRVRYFRISNSDSTDYAISGNVTIHKQVNDSTSGFDGSNAAAELAKFTMAGDKPWTLSQEDTYFGDGSLKSGAIQAGQKSIIKRVLKVKNFTTVNFKYKVSARENYDGLAVYVDGVYQESMTGWKNWSSKSYNITNDTTSEYKMVTIEWVYYRGSTTSGNDNCAYLDNIEINNY